MAWKRGNNPKPPDFERLRSALNNSKVVNDNPALYQVINGILHSLKQYQDYEADQVAAVRVIAEEAAAGGGGSGSSGAPTTSTYLTEDNESANLPNSRQLLAGTNVSFDDSTPNERTINVTAASVDYVVMSDGDVAAPTPINDGAGNFIYIPYSA